MKKSELRNIIREVIQELNKDPGWPAGAGKTLAAFHKQYGRTPAQISAWAEGEAISKAKKKLKKIKPAIRKSVKSGELRQKHGLDTSFGSDYHFWRQQGGLSDTDAQIMVYINLGIIKETMGV